jgi:tetratricopeptide (TPR) repeat protein
MSPEQYVGARTDARTDQFSFCVALYEALYGEHPFGGGTIAELAERVLGPVRKHPPKSTPVPERVRKAILRGLSTAPDDRHPSMRELLHELEAAQAPRRRKRALVLAAASLLAMGALWARHPRAQPCSGASSRLAGAWSEQTRSAVTAAILTSGSAYAADAAARATNALDAYATAWRASSTESCQSTERHEQSQTLLDLRAACLNERLEEFTALTRILQQNAAEVTSRSISAVLALTPVSSCAPGALLTTERLPDSTELRAQIAQVRTYIAEAKAFSDAGLYPQSLERATQSVHAAASTAYPPAVAESLLRQGLSEHKVGRSLVSTVTLARALDAAERAGLDELRMLAAIELLKANTHASRFDEAEKFAAVAAAISDRLHQPPLLEVDRLDAICVLRLSQEKFGEAQASCACALARLQSLAQPPDDKLARELSALGNAELRLGHVEAAIEDEKRALSILERSLEPDNSNVAEQLDEVGSMLAFTGRYAEADALQSRAVAIAEKTFSAEHPAYGVILENYARTLFYQKKWNEAEKMRRRALQIFERSEPYPGYRAHILMGLAEISLAQHKLDQASRELEQAEQLAQQANGPDSLEVSGVRDLLGRVARERGKFAAAIAFHERVYASVTKIVGKDHPDVAVCLFNLGNDYLAAGAGERAVESFTRALAIDERATDASVAQRLVSDREHLAKAKLLASTQAAR